MYIGFGDEYCADYYGNRYAWQDLRDNGIDYSGLALKATKDEYRRRNWKVSKGNY